MEHLITVLVSCVGVMLSVALGLRDPYTRIEAESMDVNNGVTIFNHPTCSGSKYIQHIHSGDHIGFKQLNFSTETVAIEWESHTFGDGNPLSQVSLRLDTPASTPFLTHSIDTVTSQWLTSIRLIPTGDRPRGVHDLYFTFQHPGPTTYDLVAIDWFRFVTLESLLPPSYKTGTASVCPTPPPPLCTCPTPQPTTDSLTQCQVSIDQCHNSTQSHKQIVINIY